MPYYEGNALRDSKSIHFLNKMLLLLNVALKDKRGYTFYHTTENVYVCDVRFHSF